MKWLVSKNLVCRITVVIVLLNLFVVTAFAEMNAPPIGEGKEVAGDINGNLPPGQAPPESKWYEIQTRELINSAIEGCTGMTPNDTDKSITLGQAAHIAYYAYDYMNTDHGYEEEFNERCLEKGKRTVSFMGSFEGRDVGEHEIATREQLVHIIVAVFGSDAETAAVDPSVERDPSKKMTMIDFEDNDKITGYYQSDFVNAIKAGYLVGVDDFKLEPKERATLKDLVAVLERAINVHRDEHSIRIAAVMAKSKWSEFNYHTLGITSMTISSIGQFGISVIIALLPIIWRLLRKKSSSKKKERRKVAEGYIG